MPRRIAGIGCQDDTSASGELVFHFVGMDVIAVGRGKRRRNCHKLYTNSVQQRGTRAGVVRNNIRS